MNEPTNASAAPYLKLAIALTASLAIMYGLTFALVDVGADIKPSLGNLYMALMMVFPMGIVMLVVMWRMFPVRAANVVLLVGFAGAFVAALVMGRTGVFIGDTEFLNSMIPHHSRAILLCEEASIDDPEIIGLCREIIETQQDEIDQMNDILDRY